MIDRPNENLLSRLEQSLRQSRAARMHLAARLRELEVEADAVRAELAEMDTLATQSESLVVFGAGLQQSLHEQSLGWSSFRRGTRGRDASLVSANARAISGRNQAPGNSHAPTEYGSPQRSFHGSNYSAGSYAVVT